MPLRFQAPVVVGALSLLTSVTYAQRSTSDLAAGWKFTKGDAALTAPIDAWEKVTVPHTWNAVDGELGKVRNPGEKEGYYRGACWYERTLKIPAAWKGKRVFIRFEAAALVSKTYLNGELLGEHRGGFTAFCYELTPHLHFGEENELRVQVDNSRQDNIPPRSGDFNIDGGIYRPVQLIVTDSICITPLDFASPGVYLTTKSLDDTSAGVEVKSLISNVSGSPEEVITKTDGENRTLKIHQNPPPAKVVVETEIKDAAGKPVAKSSSEQTLDANKTTPVLANLNIPKPHRWNGRKDPYLYSVTVHVLKNGKLIDSVTQPLGLRTVEITQEQGFLLNNAPYPIHGVNRHQDAFNKGWAITPANHQEDARLILDMGTTAIRLAHYPQSEYFHDLCDRNGLLLWNEVSLVNSIADAPEFSSNAEQQLRELILQRYNHPSAVFWGTFNELENEKTPPPDALLQHLKDVIHELDPSRIDVGASDHAPRTYNHIPTGICFNAYPGWYGNGMPDDMAKYIDDRANEVGKRIGMSEYGGGANSAQHEEGAPQKIDQKGQFHPEEWQSYIHEREWAILQNNPKVWGTFLWVMFDFPSARRNEGDHPGLNDKGLVTQDRKVKKDAYFFYKANWNPEPMVYIASRRSTPRKLASTEVKVYTNCAEVSLKVNGKSIGAAKPDEVKIARWPDVALQPGKNIVEVTAQANGKPIADHCEWVLESNNSTVAPQ